MNIKKFVPIIIVSSLTLISCGGGSGGGGSEGVTYRGATTPATVTIGNAGNLAISATAGVTMVIADESSNYTPRGLSARNSGNLSFILEQSKLAARRLSENSTAARAEPCPDGGTIDSSGSENNGTIRFNSCRVLIQSPLDPSINDYVIFNGKISYEYSENSTSETSIVRLTRFSVRFESGDFPTQSITMTATEKCLYVTPFGCTLLLDYIGFDGRTYRIDGNYTIYSDVNGYDITVEVYDPNYGFVGVSAVDIRYQDSDTSIDCPRGVPGSGVITIIGEGSTTATITFNDCEQFTVTPPGSTPGGAEDEVYFWVDIL